MSTISYSKSPNEIYLELFNTFVPKLILEVFGAGGAMWGFSEVLTLRTAETVWFWRPVATVVGFIFFIRWCFQMKDFLEEGIEETVKVTGSGKTEADPLVVKYGSNVSSSP